MISTLRPYLANSPASRVTQSAICPAPRLVEIRTGFNSWAWPTAARRIAANDTKLKTRLAGDFMGWGMTLFKDTDFFKIFFRSGMQRDRKPSQAGGGGVVFKAVVHFL